MKKTILISLVTILISPMAFAANKAVEKAAKNMKANDVRTVVREVENTDGNPCMPEGKSYQVDLQVKSALGYDHEKGKIVYEWQTVKTIGVDQDGLVMEVCAE